VGFEDAAGVAAASGGCRGWRLTPGSTGFSLCTFSF
jgi:hypothetical protein